MNDILTPGEAAEFLKVKVSKIYRLTSENKIPFRKIGGSLRFIREELLNWVLSGDSAK